MRATETTKGGALGGLPSQIPFTVCWVVLASISLGFIASGLYGEGLGEVPLWSLAAWLAFVAVGDLLLIPLWGDVQFSLSLPALLAAGMVLDPAIAAALAFIGFIDFKDWGPKYRFGRAMANRGQVAISAGSASLVFHSLGGDLTDWPSVIAAAGAALAVDCIVNASLVAVAVALRRGVRLSLAARQLVLDFKPALIVCYLCLGALGLLVATTYTHVGEWALLVGLAPMFLAAQMLNRWRQLLDTSKTLADRNKLLVAASEQAVLEREDERKLIASAIHDDVLQSLHYLMLHAQVIREDLRHGRLLQLEEDVPVLLRASQTTADLARAVVKGLRESPIGRGGVVSTLELLVEELREEFAGEIATRLESVPGSPAIQTYIYQVAREGLVNAVRHSGASRIDLELVDLGGQVLLRVKDNGKGFDPSQGAPPGHFGLSLMRERVNTAGGDITVKSESGTGTTVEALFGSDNPAAGGAS